MEQDFVADKVIFKNLSYQIMGIVFDVYNELGGGYKECYYQKALEIAFTKHNIKFRSQAPYLVCYQGQAVGRQFMDFVIDGKVILEIKQGDHFSRQNFNQVNGYLKASGLRLAILVNFTSKGVKFKRLLNTKQNVTN